MKKPSSSAPAFLFSSFTLYVVGNVSNDARMVWQNDQCGSQKLPFQPTMFLSWISPTKLSERKGPLGYINKERVVRKVADNPSSFAKCA